MNNIVTRFKYLNFILYCSIFYSFFTHLGYKKGVDRVNDDMKNQVIPSYSILDLSSRKTKIFLDLNYKDMISSYSLSTEVFSCTLDTEGKILGYKIFQGKRFATNIVSTTISLNKKLLNSTLFGSIKLIKL